MYGTGICSAQDLIKFVRVDPMYITIMGLAKASLTDPLLSEEMAPRCGLAKGFYHSPYSLPNGNSPKIKKII